MNVFVFSAGFRVNDTEWLEVMAEQTVISEVFTILYPFLREKIFAYTSDFRPGFMLPILEAGKLDLTKKITFNLNKVEPLAH